MCRAILRALLARLGDGAQIGRAVGVPHPRTFEIGAGFYLGDQTILQGRHDGRCTIGERVQDRPAGEMLGIEPKELKMRQQVRSGLSLAAGAALAAFLQVVSGLWSAPALAQSVNTTSESTTAETTYNFISPPGSLTVAECPFVGNGCPSGTTPQVIGSNVTVTVTTTIGPATVLFGACQSQTLPVVPGGEDINTNVDTHTFVNCLANAVAVPTLSVWGLGALAAALGAVALRRLSLPP